MPNSLLTHTSGPTGHCGRVVIVMHDVGALSRLLRSRDRYIRCRIVQPLISEALVRNHERAARGREPSDDLRLVLAYLGRHPDPDAPRYNIVGSGPGGPYLVARNLRRRGDVPRILAEPTFETVAEARHHAFLLQLTDYGLLGSGKGPSVHTDPWQNASMIQT